MQIITRRFNVTVRLLVLLVVLASGPFAAHMHAASLGASGYTNSFTPPAADWSTVSIAGGAGDIGSAVAMDTAVGAVAPSSVTVQLPTDVNSPPNSLAQGTWSSSGFYVQTRPTGNAATLVMCTLVNSLGQGPARTHYDG